MFVDSLGFSWDINSQFLAIFVSSVKCRSYVVQAYWIFSWSFVELSQRLPFVRILMHNKLFSTFDVAILCSTSQWLCLWRYQLWTSKYTNLRQMLLIIHNNEHFSLLRNSQNLLSFAPTILNHGVLHASRGYRWDIRDKAWIRYVAYHFGIEYCRFEDTMCLVLTVLLSGCTRYLGVSHWAV